MMMVTSLLCMLGGIKMLDELLKSKDYISIYKVARWAYKIGTPIFSDETFDKFEIGLKKLYPDDDIFNHSYEDDVEPFDILDKYNISLQSKTVLQPMLKTETAESFDTEPISQKPVRTKEEAYQWYKQWNGKDICHTLKVDGISTRTLLSKRTGLVQESYSKGRRETVTSFTKTMKKKLNAGLLANITGSEGHNILVSAECIVDNKGLIEINRVLHSDYKNGRSAALGLLSTDIKDSFRPYIHLFVFSHSDLNYTYSSSLNKYNNLGFEKLPMIVSKFQDTGFSDFVEWIDNITKELKQCADNLFIQADGVVARVDNMELYHNAPTTELYSDASLALKFNEFHARTYKTKVLDISLEFQGNSSENYTTKLTVEPFLTDDNKTISKVTGYNLSYIISKGILPGSEINILYQSGCYPMLG